MNLRFCKHEYKGFGHYTGILLPVLLLFILGSGCKITQEIKDGEHLVNRNEIEGMKETGLTSDAKQLIRQKPNKRLFGFYRFYLRAYNFGMRGDTSRWLRRNVRIHVGEPPVVLDSNMLQESANQINGYLFNHGYYNAKVKYEVHERGRKGKKADIVFKVTPGDRWKIKEITYGIDGRRLNYLITSDSGESLVKRGDYFNAETMVKERERITAKLRNEGYYFFNKEYVVYSVDSLLPGNYVNVDIQVRNPSLFSTHTPYYIKDIYINVMNPVPDDTANNKPDWRRADSMWVNMNGYRLHESVLLRSVIMRPGDLFKQSDVDNSYNRFNGVKLFRQSTITFEKDSSEEGLLVCYINLVPLKKQQYILEPQVITSDQSSAVEQSNQRNFGIAAVLQYQNRNVFQHAELLEMRYRASFESQIKTNDSIPIISNIEHSVFAKIGLPRISILRRLQRFPNVSNMSSDFSANFVYESNVDFKRNVMAVSYGELFDVGALHKLNVTLFEMSYNRVDAKRNFLALVNPADSIFIANLFVTNLITASRVIYTYSDKKWSRDGTNFFFRGMMEFAGNSLYGLVKATRRPLPPDGIYKIDNVNFEQYIKVDADVRYTKVLNELHTMAYRLHTGAGWAYGNSEIMPFVRRYFIGGANSLRGWRPRTLGPGSFTTNQAGVRADRSGEVIIEAQTEYRFSIIRNALEGAAFVDAGNIWYTHPVAGRSGVEFRWGDFLGQMAVNTGLGLRFDFSFVKLRFDFGVPIRNPELPLNSRWLFNEYEQTPKKVFSSTILNLGLNYPF